MLNKDVKNTALGALLDARMQHTKWVSEVLHNPDAQVAEDHTRCEFGKWLLAAGDELKALPAFQSLEAPHNALHEAYKMIKHTPDLDERRVEIEQFSNRLIDCIDRLEQTLQHA
ncbi:MAG: CZB domain-containing protein [Halopseudomonas sp.]